ncbi:MAG: tRNA dihydrouridine synthase DusB [Gammaproteobacteria bacterium]|nr:tRNA dihydrouridine synthase DusB [Gammaproteobacteria bacterium]
MRLGPYSFATPIILAPMAGVSDRAFRALCRAHGADYAPSEMTAADPALRATPQTQRRLDLRGELAPRIVQIAGADSEALANAARASVDEGAEIVDINMGCPAKRVCNRLAGSALLKDESLVARILSTVTRAVAVPVTLKTRTGWDLAHRNAVTIARMAENCGIQALTLHGRTRACGYQGQAEYATIAAVKAAVTIPVIANGDITTPEQARSVLALTGADGLMIGRAAQGDPWLFARIKAYLADGIHLLPPTRAQLLTTVRQHLAQIHDLYGTGLGVRIARKHAHWYLTRWRVGGAAARARFNGLDSANAQIKFFENDQEHLFGEAA